MLAAKALQFDPMFFNERYHGETPLSHRLYHIAVKSLVLLFGFSQPRRAKPHSLPRTRRAGSADESEEHFVVGLLAAADGLRRGVGVVRVGRAVVVDGLDLQLRAGG